MPAASFRPTPADTGAVPNWVKRAPVVSRGQTQLNQIRTARFGRQKRFRTGRFPENKKGFGEDAVPHYMLDPNYNTRPNGKSPKRFSEKNDWEIGRYGTSRFASDAASVMRSTSCPTLKFATSVEPRYLPPHTKSSFKSNRNYSSDSVRTSNSSSGRNTLGTSASERIRQTALAMSGCVKQARWEKDAQCEASRSQFESTCELNAHTHDKAAWNKSGTFSRASRRPGKNWHFGKPKVPNLQTQTPAGTLSHTSPGRYTLGKPQTSLKASSTPQRTSLASQNHHASMRKRGDARFPYMKEEGYAKRLGPGRYDVTLAQDLGKTSNSGYVDARTGKPKPSANFQDRRERIVYKDYDAEYGVGYKERMAKKKQEQEDECLDGTSVVEQYYRQRRMEEMIRSRVTKGKLKLNVHEMTPLPLGFDNITLSMMDPDFVAPDETHLL